MSSHSARAVATAIVTNALVTVLKFAAAITSTSSSMANEAVHSLMDTLNQLFLLAGLKAAARPADETYAFGHRQKKFMWNLWSAIGLFSIGCGLGLSHAWHAWRAPGPAEAAQTLTLFGHTVGAVWVSLAVLAFAFLLEGYSFWVALGEFRARMRAAGTRRPLSYLLRAGDPTLMAVVLEDSVAVLGLSFVALGIGLTYLTGQRAWDIGFSVLIALMLGAVAFFLGFINTRYLTDMRDERAEAAFRRVVAEHPEVERFHDLRSIMLDESSTVLVAEVELREEAMVASLHRHIDGHRARLLAQVPEGRRERQELLDYVDARAAVQATLEHTERVIEELAEAVRRAAPQVVHVTVEVEGIHTAPAEDGALSVSGL